VLPPLCLLCAAPSSHANLCDGCRTELPYLPAERCPRCAAPSPQGFICGACLAHPPHYDRVLCACAYAFPLDRVIQRFKFAADLAAAPLLAQLMAGAIDAADLPDVIVPMPLSDERLRSRGFNQALELARLLTRATGVRLAPRGCMRVRHDAAQSALPFAQRSRNVRGAFVSLEDFSGLSVAVVDDVLTTGATLNEVASVLRRTGAARVQGWIAARTLPPGAQPPSLRAGIAL
jgi:ComF family protein